MTTALAPRLTTLDERVLRQVPDVGPGIRARHIAATLNRNLPTYSRNRVDVGDVPQEGTPMTCTDCGVREARVRGRCPSCYQRWHRRSNPAVAERTRAAARAWKAAHREQNRARDKAFSRREDVRGRCLDCGGPMGIGNRHDGTCVSCIAAQAERRAAQIVERWDEGQKIHEIAAAFGSSVSSMSVEVHRLRKAGRIGYRNNGYGAPAVAPEESLPPSEGS